MTERVAAEPRRRRPGSLLVAASFALALAASAYALLGPSGSWEDSTGRSGTTTLWGDIRNGDEDAFLLWVVFLPTAFALAALLLDATRIARVTRAAAAVLMLGFAFLTGFSVGLFFFPAALAMAAAAVLPGRATADPAP